MKAALLLLLFTIRIVKQISSTGCNLKSDPVTQVTDDRSNQQLQTIPSDVSHVVTNLILASNHIQTCEERIFERYSHLRHLNLANNSIHWFHENCFSGLRQLEYLNLENNSFRYDTIPTKLFRTLYSLQDLVLSKRDAHDSDVYPGRQLAALPCMQELVISGLQGIQLPIHFGLLTSLHTLVFTGTGSTLHSVSMDMFQNIVNLPIKQLSFWRSGLRSLPDNLQQYVPNLESLNLACNEMSSIKKVIKWFSGLQNCTIKQLYLDSVTKEDAELTSFRVSDMCPNGRNLQALSVRNIKASTLELDMYYRDPNNCLKHAEILRVGYNTARLKNLAYSVYLPSLTKAVPPIVVYFDFGGYFNAGDMINLCGTDLPADSSFSPLFHLVKYPEFEPVKDVHPPVKVKPKDTDYFHLKPPKSLRYIYFNGVKSGSHNDLSISVDPDNSIVLLDLSNSGLPEVRRTALLGFFQMQLLNISHNNIRYIGKDVCSYCINLKIIDVSHNKLGSMPPKDLASTIATLQAPGLEYVNLSYNELYSIDTNLFSTKVNLKEILLKGNRINAVTFTLAYNTKLNVLDLSENFIMTLDYTFMHNISEIYESKDDTMVLRVAGNPFLLDCSPSALKFTIWLKDNSFLLEDWNDIRVTRESNDYRITKSVLSKLINDCDDHGYMYVFPVIIAIVLIVLAIACARHYRWKIRWAFYTCRLENRDHFNTHAQSSARPHAFVAHNHTFDYPWVVNTLLPVVEDQWGMKLFLGYRDFPAGGSIAENIIKAINISHKTILVVTPAYLESQWCDFETNIALLKGIQHVVIIKMGGISENKVPKLMKYLLKSVIYLEYKDDDQKRFFEQLYSILQI